MKTKNKTATRKQWEDEEIQVATILLSLFLSSRSRCHHPMCNHLYRARILQPFRSCFSNRRASSLRLFQPRRKIRHPLGTRRELHRATSPSANLLPGVSFPPFSLLLDHGRHGEGKYRSPRHGDRRAVARDATRERRSESPSRACGRHDLKTAYKVNVSLRLTRVSGRAL